MALSYRARKRLALLILLVGLPLYIIAAWWLVNWIERPSIWLELGVYIGLGFLWMLPLRRIFIGIAQPDPEAREDHQD